MRSFSELDSVSPFIRTLYIWPRDRVIGRVDCGMFNEGIVYESFMGMKERSIVWRLVRMVNSWHQPVSTPLLRPNKSSGDQVLSPQLEAQIRVSDLGFFVGIGDVVYRRRSID